MSLNTQLTIKLTNPSGESTITVSYKPSGVQATDYLSSTKTLDSLLNLGTETSELYSQLSTLNTLLKSKVIIHDYLVSQGVNTEDVSADLNTKMLTVSKLLNSLPQIKLSQVITLLTNSFVKESNFYDFSLGLLEVVGKKIKSELNDDFTKIKRRIDPSWKVNVLIESVNSSTYQKTSSFSFKDNYEFVICDIGGVENITYTISTMFISSIKPYVDIYMEKIVTDALRSLHGQHESPYGIHNQIEKLAWNLFNEDGSNRHEELTAYSQFDDLVKSYEEKFSDASLYRPLHNTYPHRQVTAAVSMSDDARPKSSKLDYKNFGTYHNSYHYNYMELKKKELPTPPFLTLEEIKESIHRTKRYFTIYKLGEDAISKLLELKDLENFSLVVSALKVTINELMDAVCLLYKEDSELTV